MVPAGQHPPLARIREVSANIGAAVVKVAYDAGLACGARPRNLLALVRKTMFDPRYPDYAQRSRAIRRFGVCRVSQMGPV